MENEVTIYNRIFRIPIHGESTVGKTSIYTKYLNNTFQEGYMPTVGFDKSRKKVTVNDQIKGEFQINLSLMDTMGQERFRSITKNDIKIADGIVVVFSVTDKLSFEQVTYWMNQMQENNDKVPIILIGNKIDLDKERVVEKDEAETLAAELRKENKDVEYFETSAKTGEGIEKAFNALAQKAYEAFKRNRPEERISIAIDDHRVEEHRN